MSSSHQHNVSIYDDPRMVEQRARGERATMAIRRARETRAREGLNETPAPEKKPRPE